jgi:hypothetical protein
MNRSIELHENVQEIQKLARDVLAVLELYYGGAGGAVAGAAAAGGASVEQLPDEG